MVNGSGSGAGPLMCSFNCTCWPDKVCTSIDVSCTGSAARAVKLIAANATNAIAHVIAARI
jgi:hypothetical protein